MTSAALSPNQFLLSIFRSMLALTIMGGLYFVSWVSVDVSDYIDVVSIDVEDHEFGTPEKMAVSRSIKQDFEGGYRVEIREAETNASVCATGYIPSSYQRHTANGEDLTTLPKNLTLDWWAYGGKCIALLSNPLGPGRYVMTTCHYVYHPWKLFPKREKCWMPRTVWEVYPLGEHAQKGE